MIEFFKRHSVLNDCDISIFSKHMNLELNYDKVLVSVSDDKVRMFIEGNNADDEIIPLLEYKPSRTRNRIFYDNLDYYRLAFKLGKQSYIIGFYDDVAD